MVRSTGKGYIASERNISEFDAKDGRKILKKSFSVKVRKPKWDVKDDKKIYYFYDLVVTGGKDAKKWLKLKTGAEVAWIDGRERLWEMDKGGYVVQVFTTLSDLVVDDTFTKENNEGIDVNTDDLPPF